jgi:hypothetical protein
MIGNVSGLTLLQMQGGEKPRRPPFFPDLRFLDRSACLVAAIEVHNLLDANNPSAG